MKLEITYNEAISLIRRNLNLIPEVVVVITDVPIVNPVNPVHPVIEVLISDINKMCGCGDKVRAIKRFRETVSCGLGQAQWAVENWAEVEDWMKWLNRLPKFEGLYSDGTIRMV